MGFPAAALLVACGDSIVTDVGGTNAGDKDSVISPQPSAVASITLLPASDTLVVWETLLARALVRDAEGNLIDTALSWSSSDTSVMKPLPRGYSLDSTRANGLVPKNSGNVTISAAAGDVVATIDLTAVEWRLVPHPGIRYLLDVWGIDADDVWAVGWDCFPNCLLHWDGATWDSIPGTGGSLYGVSTVLLEVE